MRLAKFIAVCGYASRRHAEDLIRSGAVTLKGRCVTDPAFDVTDDDIVAVGGNVIKPPDKFIYLILNKPLGVVSTMALGKERGLPLTSLIPLPDRIHPVGRLDMDSSGLLLLTNDGDLTNRLTHPSRKVEKEYLVKLNRPLNNRDYQHLAHGVEIDGRVVEIDDFTPLRPDKARIVIHEGRKRIIRLMFRAIGVNVLELKRTRIGPISLGKLSLGKWRYLTDREVEALKETVKRKGVEG